MNAIFKAVCKVVTRVVDRINGSGVMQELNVPMGMRYITEGMPRLARQAAAESIVLLENNGVLPLVKGAKVALFGRCQNDYFYVGYGSGGDVKAPYTVSLCEAMKACEKEGLIVLNKDVDKAYADWCSDKKNRPFDGVWGHWPMNYPEMPLETSFIAKAAEDSDVAVVVLGRAAGEDRENTLTKGSYYLTDEEERLLDAVSRSFKETVVVTDFGNIIDMSWTRRFAGRLSAVVQAWQGGMESGNAVADVLTGKVNPCGKMPDTVALAYEDYPSSSDFGGRDYNEYSEDIFVGYRYFETFAKDKVLYPFGFGLSYTSFDIIAEKFICDKGVVTVCANVKNTGKVAGKEVVQMYLRAPQGKLGKADKVLVAFAKTGLIKPGESCTVTLTCSEYDCASFDDTGAVKDHAYVLEKGKYVFLLGSDVRTEYAAGDMLVEEDKILAEKQGICGVKDPFMRIKAEEKDGKIVKARQKVSARDYNLKERILSQLPENTVFTGDRGIKLKDVADGTYSMEEFVAQLSPRELQALTRGKGYMGVEEGVDGNAGSYGGVIDSLKEKGVPQVITADGPAGIRISRFTSLLPCGTALAASFDTELVRQLYAKIGEEMAHYGVHVLLGAGMNIHRNPLCGRNFEYYSEDPLLTGKMAAAFVGGVQQSGRGACPKHFACNNQEVRRTVNDSRVSERALREIYLRGFEICIRESDPSDIMTSYNKLNGVWNHYNFDLIHTLLRQEWGYDGLVITDWWMHKGASPEFPKLKDNAYRVRSRVDVLMPGNNSHTKRRYKADSSLLRTLGKKGGITRGELEAAAIHTLTSVIRLTMNPGYNKVVGKA